MSSSTKIKVFRGWYCYALYKYGDNMFHWIIKFGNNGEDIHVDNKSFNDIKRIIKSHEYLIYNL